MRAYPCLVLIAALTACHKEDAKDEKPVTSGAQVLPAETPALPAQQQLFVSNQVQTWDEVGDLAGDAPVIRSELKDSFCVNVYRLQLKANFDDMLAYLCEDKKPAEIFDKIDRYAGRVGTSPRSVKLALTHEKDGFTRGTYIVAYRVPIAPKWVRTATIPKYMVAESEFDYAKLSGAVTENLTSTLGGNLQFGKWRMQARMDIKTPDGNSFSNERRTEMNSFQVEGGNPDIGIGSEHLIETPNPDFKDYRTATITISNQDDSATLITIITLSIRNNGFPETAERVFSDITTSQATQVHHGLMAEYTAGVFNTEEDSGAGNL